MFGENIVHVCTYNVYVWNIFVYFVYIWTHVSIMGLFGKCVTILGIEYLSFYKSVFAQIDYFVNF